MFRVFFLLSIFSFIYSWIPLTTIDDNHIKTPICIKNKAYFIDDRYIIYDNSKKPIFEKMITRSLYGNINASRNSA